MEPCLALVAHDGKKPEMVAFALLHLGLLRRCRLLATAATGRLLTAETGLRVDCLHWGPTGGDAQVAAHVAMGEVDAVVFMVDLLAKHPLDPNVRTLLRACQTHDVPLATDRASAHLLLEALVPKELASSRD